MSNWKSKLKNWRPKLNNKIRFWLPFYARKMNAQQPTLTRLQLAIINRLLFPSTDCRLHAGISKWLATFGVEFIPSWDWQKWNPFTAISLNSLKMRVNVLESHELFICNYYLFFMKKAFRFGSDTSTSNRRPSISTSREILHFPKHYTLILRFRSILRGWTREMPWIWQRGNSRHRDRELIFSLSREWRVLNLHLLMFSLILIFFWTGNESGRV